MAKYFQTSSGQMNYITSYFYLIIGLFMIALSLWMLTLSTK